MKEEASDRHERNEVIDWGKRDPLFGMKREAFDKVLAARLRDRALAAYFFGSYCTEYFGSESDIDLIVVCATSIPFTRRPALFDDLYELVPSLDLLVYTPQEFDELIADPSPGFWRSVKEGMRQIL